MTSEKGSNHESLNDHSTNESTIPYPFFCKNQNGTVLIGKESCLKIFRSKFVSLFVKRTIETSGDNKTGDFLGKLAEQ
ncbi:MAG TPA: hypothetical protein DD473_07990 [Planctomycetaceae bacterium]|nr:hypothetical protein [Planctomycetaceae bacterium]